MVFNLSRYLLASHLFRKSPRSHFKPQIFFLSIYVTDSLLLVKMGVAYWALDDWKMHIHFLLRRHLILIVRQSLILFLQDYRDRFYSSCELAFEYFLWPQSYKPQLLILSLENHLHCQVNQKLYDLRCIFWRTVCTNLREQLDYLDFIVAEELFSPNVLIANLWVN